MKSIVIICDYKGFFESKQKSDIYRGGMDTDKIIAIFQKEGYNAQKIQLGDLNKISEFPQSSIFLYASSEDHNGLYKSFIEDIVFHWEEKGYSFLPRYAYLKAHNNKVAMELLRLRSNLDEIQTIQSKVFGTLDELENQLDSIQYPAVVKTFAGAMSRGVGKAENKRELISLAKRLSRSNSLKHDAWELLRKIKYGKLYRRESFFRNKFIVQNMIEGLNNDWKVLVYGDKCFVLRRNNRKNDFRASGSGKFLFEETVPNGILEFAWNVKNHFDVSHISLDIAFDGINFHLIEFQFLYFGTTTLEKSPHFFRRVNNNWILIKEKSVLEEVYALSIIEYLRKKENESFIHL